MKKLFALCLPAALLLALTLIPGFSPKPANAEEAKLGYLINSLPYSITVPGVYVLQQDFPNVNLASGAAINVTVDNVTIDLNGHTISNVAAGASTAASGVFGQNRANVTVRHGTFKGFLTGVYLSASGAGSAASTGHLVEDLHLSANLSAGVCVQGGNSVIRSCQIADTGGSALTGYDTAAGISLSGAGNRVLDSDISNVGASGVGILFASGSDNFAVGNQLSGPALYGIYFAGSAAGKYRKNLVSGGVARPYAGGVNIDGMDNGIPDDWEMENFGYTGVEPDDDADSDGATNVQEFASGSNPVQKDNAALHLSVNVIVR